MKYDFDKTVERRGSYSMKWDEDARSGELPLWVADMDFETAPAIIEAVTKRARHGIYGYVEVPLRYYQALTRWFLTRHSWQIDPAHVLYTTGVVPALSAALHACTKPGDGVVLLTPVYNCFFSSVRNTGCRLVEVPLIYHRGDGSYSIPFETLSETLSRPDVQALVLCNPHNPCGRIWNPDEIMRIAETGASAHVTVISDEIHCELTRPGLEYTPFAPSAQEVGCSWIALNSPSKAFNTAGLRQANIVCPDASLRSRIDRAINDMEICDVGPFGVDALIAAYESGADWLDALRGYLWDNFALVQERFSSELPECVISPLEATYLPWINVSPLGLSGNEAAGLMRDEARVRVQGGETYGAAGHGFFRLNIATRRAIVQEALDRIIPVLKAHRH